MSKNIVELAAIIRGAGVACEVCLQAFKLHDLLVGLIENNIVIWLYSFQQNPHTTQSPKNLQTIFTSPNVFAMVLQCFLLTNFSSNLSFHQMLLAFHQMVFIKCQQHINSAIYFEYFDYSGATTSPKAAAAKGQKFQLNPAKFKSQLNLADLEASWISFPAILLGQWWVAF